MGVFLEGNGRTELLGEIPLSLPVLSREGMGEEGWEGAMETSYFFLLLRDW